MNLSPSQSPEAGKPTLEGVGKRWHLRFYVAGESPRSVGAPRSLRKICEEYLMGRYEIEVIDLVANPGLATEEQILAIPTLVRQLPPPLCKIIGGLSNSERILLGLDLVPVE